MFGGQKDLTKVKTKTKIKQTYNAPVQDLNIPTTNLNPPINPQQINAPMTQPYPQSSTLQTQGPTITSMPMGGTNPIGGTNLTKNRSSSSSSSSSSQRNRNTPGMMGNANQFGQPSTLNQPTSIPTGNIQTGYGPSPGFHPELSSNTVSGATTYTGNTGPLGKNLYGETGYATQSYQPQEPFPGQTVYVEKGSQKISKKTKEKFEKPII